MPIASPEIIEGTSTIVLEELDFPIICEHPGHRLKSRKHSDEGQVFAVAGKPLPCCGFISKCHFLCEMWVTSNEFLRCPTCDRNGIPFEDCYMVFGPV